ncbi:MAG: patatin-like phospholipase family protein [Planctomycetes bacterium]|nr:patatin-like phospholipase family protein [Planctomycetota bacterium]
MDIEGKKIGLALGSGAARGLAHIGVIKAVEEYQIPINMIAGTSMGAVVGALYAAGLSGGDIEEIACNVDLKTIAKLFVPTPSLTGLIDGSKIKQLLISLVGDVDIKNLKIPFAAVAVDIENAEEVVIMDGSLAGAVRASISIPGIFTAVNHKNRLLVDGGLLNPVPVDVVRDMGADFVIAVNVPYPIKQKPVNVAIESAKQKSKAIQITDSKKFNIKLAALADEKDKLYQIKAKLNGLVKGFLENKNTVRVNVFKIMAATINIMENQIKDLQLEHHKPDILIEPKINSASKFDFRKAKQIIKIGEREAKKAFAEIL